MITEAVAEGHITRGEIDQQFALWPDSVTRAMQWQTALKRAKHPLFTGAGSSAYAAAAIAGAWPGGSAVPTTDLLLNAALCPSECDAVVSIARSGSSPESVGVVALLLRERQDLKHYAITCNAGGELNALREVDTLLLDESTNDRALAMTSSFSNLTLAGLALKHGDALRPVCSALARQGNALLQQLDRLARTNTAAVTSRAVILSSALLQPLAREVALKITELTGGAVGAMSETFLGLRHGPMSYLRSDTLVVCYLSSEPMQRRYELDVIGELRAKRLGHIVCVAAPDWLPVTSEIVPALAPELPDALRTPFEVVFGQIVAFLLSKANGLDPDVPSPFGVIHRVVQGFQLYKA